MGGIIFCECLLGSDRWCWVYPLLRMFRVGCSETVRRLGWLEPAADGYVACCALFVGNNTLDCLLLKTRDSLESSDFSCYLKTIPSTVRPRGILQKRRKAVSGASHATKYQYRHRKEFFHIRHRHQTPSHTPAVIPIRITPPVTFSPQSPPPNKSKPSPSAPRN